MILAGEEDLMMRPKLKQALLNRMIPALVRPAPGFFIPIIISKHSFGTSQPERESSGGSWASRAKQAADSMRPWVVDMSLSLSVSAHLISLTF